MIIGSSNYGSIIGGIIEIEDDTVIQITTTENSTEEARLSTEMYVAQVGDTKYKKLQSAIDACSTDGAENTITILTNFAVTGECNATVLETQNIKIDLAGYTIISFCTSSMITNNGTLVVTDASESETGTISTRANDIFINNKDITLNKGIYNLKSNGTSTDYLNVVKSNDETVVTIIGVKITGGQNYIHAIEGGIVYVKESSISISGTGKVFAIYTGGNVTVLDSTIYVAASTSTGGSGYYESYGIYIYDDGKLICDSTSITAYARYGAYNVYYASTNKESYISNISISASGTSVNSGIYNVGEGTITIKSGNISRLYNTSSGIIEVDDGTISGYTVNSGIGTININVGTFSSISNSGTGIINIYNATISSYVNNSNTGTINIYDGTISSYVQNSSTGTIKIYGGTIT